MTTLRLVCLASLACLWLVTSARADLPSPRPQPPPDPVPQPAPPQPPVDPVTGKPLWDYREEKKPRRTGPFRSCGSGMGTGLAGIGLAWGLFWVGNRFAGRVRARKDERTD